MFRRWFSRRSSMDREAFARRALTRLREMPNVSSADMSASEDFCIEVRPQRGPDGEPAFIFLENAGRHHRDPGMSAAERDREFGRWLASVARFDEEVALEPGRLFPLMRHVDCSGEDVAVVRAAFGEGLRLPADCRGTVVRPVLGDMIYVLALESDRNVNFVTHAMLDATGDESCGRVVACIGQSRPSHFVPRPARVTMRVFSHWLLPARTVAGAARAAWKAEPACGG